LWIYVEVDHSSAGDLLLELESPRGTSITLWDGSSYTGGELEGVFDRDFPVDEGPNALDQYLGENILGTWTLTVSNQRSGVSGTLVSWCVQSNLSGFPFDLDGGGEVDAKDVLILIDSMQMNGQIDFDGNGHCGPEDLFLFSREWGR